MKIFLTIILLIIPITNFAFATVTTPTSIIYEGKLLDNSNNAITTAHSFRVSLWSSGDMIVGDVDGTGAINTLSPAYGGWQEVRNIIPNSDGTFSFPLGQLIPLPEMYLSLHKFLQVEIKISTDPDTSYQSMDPTGDDGLDTDDRQLIGSSPFAKNADYIDNAEVGINTGDLAILGAGDIWDIDFIPGGTNSNSFILDDDDTAVAGESIFLQFGNILAKTFGFNITNNWFEFSENVSFNQHEIKDVVIDNLALAPATPIAGQIYHNISNNNTYIYNGAIWEDITANSGTIDWNSLPTRIKQATLSPNYPNASTEKDGTNNRGKLVLDFEDNGGINKHSYYEWTTMQAGIQNINIISSFELPLDFDGFTNTPLSFDYKTSDAILTTNKIDIELYDTNGNNVVLIGGSDLANGSWSTNNITFSGSPVFTAGNKITLKIKLSSTNTGFVKASNIIFHYNGK